MQEAEEGSSCDHIHGILVPRLSAALSLCLNARYPGMGVLTQNGGVLAQPSLQQH